MRRTLLCLVVAILTWNVMFDRLVQAGEKQYLALEARHEPGVSIRGVMEPAVRHAATIATLYAAGAVALTALVLLAAARRSTRRDAASSSSPPASS